MEAVWIGCAFFMGMVVKKMGLPSLIGYLIAGFMIPLVSSPLGLPDSHGETLNHIAHAGVLLLLFTVGLKLKVGHVVKKEVFGTGTLHMILSMAIFTPVILFIFKAPLMESIIVSGMLSFSSTVLAVKVLESKQEVRAFHGRIAIGILIVQDLLAMGMLSATSGHLPSLWAIPVILFLCLPITKTILYKILDSSGHDEMLLLCGLVLALVVGGQGFHALGLSGELGALIIGVLCSKHAKATELSKSLWGLKEVFLVGFFLTIGLNGTPSLEDLWFALAMVALLPIQGIVFFLILTRFRLKARSAFLTSTTLTNFSEFGLIVAAVAAPNWIVPIALAVAISFLVSAPLNRYAHPLFDKLEWFLSRFEREVEHPDAQIISLGDARLLIMGMGQIGRAAYNSAGAHYSKGDIIGLDSDAEKIKQLASDDYDVHYADAEHGNFWESLDTKNLKAIILAMDCPDASLIATKKLRKYGFDGVLVSHTQYADDAKKIQEAGANQCYITFEEAGRGLFEGAMQHKALRGD